MLFGAVVGGPDESDCWNDDRTNWERNEVALDYNAPYVGLLAWARKHQAPPPSPPPSTAAACTAAAFTAARFVRGESNECECYACVGAPHRRDG